MSAAARVDAVGWGWRHAGRRRWAAREIDLRIEPGERVLLLGASGAGKSTLLRGLAGVLGDTEDGETEGRLLVDGVAPERTRGRAGLVLQDPDAQVLLARVGDDIAFGCENLGVPRGQIWPRVREAMDAVGLDVALDRATAALSGGQKQRLALAGALAMRPGLLLLDEPTANVDPAGAQQVRDAVVRAVARAGTTLVVVEHRVSLWADHVDRVIVLSGEGGLLADGAPAQVFAQQRDALTAAGVWVPGVRDEPPARPRLGTAEPLLRAEDLAVGRRAFAQKRPVAVAHGIHAVARAGRALAVTGRNGTGKSTLAATLSGLRPPVSGGLVASDALRAGAGADPGRWRSRQLLTRIGAVFQDPEHQLLTTRVRDELAVGPRALGLPDAEVAARVEPLLERLRLNRLAAANPFTLSGGEKRRLTVAAALATRPRVLVLDEPTYGQDARTWRELAALIDEVRGEGTAVVFVSHDVELVRVLADERLVLGGAA